MKEHNNSDPNDEYILEAYQYLKRGLILREQNELEKAIEVFKKGFAIAQDKIPSSNNLLYAFPNHIADLHLAIGNYESAEKEVIEFLEKYSDSAPEEINLSFENILSHVYIRTGQYQKAEPLLLNSIKIKTKKYGEHSAEIFTDLHTLATIFCISERRSDAKKILQQMYHIEDITVKGTKSHREMLDLLEQLETIVRPQKKLSSESEKSNEPPEENDFLKYEYIICRLFFDRDYKNLLKIAQDSFPMGVNSRTVGAYLIGLMEMGHSTNDFAQYVQENFPKGTWLFDWVEFILGRISHNKMLEQFKEHHYQCQIFFFAGMLFLRSRNIQEARECFTKVLPLDTKMFEKDQAKIELDALDNLAIDFSRIPQAKQEHFIEAYRKCINFEPIRFLEFYHKCFESNTLTPELILMYLISIKFLGANEFLNTLLPLFKRILVLWPFHLKLIDVLMDESIPQQLIPITSNEKEICQLHFYLMLFKLYQGDWQDISMHREKALDVEADCLEKKLSRYFGEAKHEVISNLSNYLMNLYHSGYIKQVEKIACSALKECRNLPDIPNDIIYHILQCLALAVGSSGKIAESKQYLDEMDKLPNQTTKNQFYNAHLSAHVFHENGFYNEAHSQIIKAIKIQKEIELSNLDRISFYNTVGLISLSIDDPQESIKWFSAALSKIESVESTNEKLLKAVITDNLGTSYCISRNVSKAIELHEFAFNILKEMANAHNGVFSEYHPSVQKNIQNLSMALSIAGRKEEAEKYIQDAIKIATISNSHSILRGLKIQLSLLLMNLNREDEAMREVINASQLNEIIIDQILSLDTESLKMSYSSTAFFDLMLLLNIVYSDINKKVVNIIYLYNVLLRRKNLITEQTVLRRDAILKRYPDLRPILQEYNNLKIEIASIEQSLIKNQDSSVLLNWLFIKKNRLSSLEKKLTDEVPEGQLHFYLNQVDVNQLIDTMPKNWSVIEIIKLPKINFNKLDFDNTKYFHINHYWAVIIPSANIEQINLIDLGAAREIEELLMEFMHNLGDFPDNDLEPLRNKVIEKIVLPLTSNLPEIGHLLIAPDGIFAKIAFDVLPDSEYPFLCDRFSTSYLTTLRDITRKSIETQETNSSDIVIAAPDFGLVKLNTVNEIDGFEPLNGAMKEGEIIGSLLGVEPWTGKNANKKNLLNVSSPRILHIATHGYYSKADTTSYQLTKIRLRSVLNTNIFGQQQKNSMFESGLALSGANLSPHNVDGIISAAEVVGLNLSATDIVVLSACDTGLGNPHSTEGVIGLRRAFQMAGAKTVIVSLWKIPDEQVIELMVGFYTRMLNGLPKGEALKAAQNEMRKKYPSPFYWGAFICYGDVGPLYGIDWPKHLPQSDREAKSNENHIKIKWLTQRLEFESNNGELYLERGVLYHNIHRYDEAISNYNKAAELIPNSSYLYMSRGFSYYALGHVNKAIEDYNRSICLDENLGPAYHRRGNAFSKRGQINEAMNDLSRAIELMPENDQAWYDRANNYADLKEYQLAIYDYSQTIKLNSEFQMAYVNRGTIYLETGKFDKAIEDFVQGLKLNPGDTLAHFNLGMAYMIVEDHQKAYQSFLDAARYGDSTMVDMVEQVMSDTMVSEKLLKKTKKKMNLIQVDVQNKPK